jgi:hypothetical protein
MTGTQWEAASGAGSQDYYTGHRLLYRASPSVGDRAFWLISPITAIKASLALFVLSWLCIFPAGLIGYVLNSNALATIVWIALVVLVCLIPWREWASQWELTLDEKGARAEQAFVAISDAVERHHLPVSRRVKRVRPQITGPLRYYLSLYDRPYHAFVGVFAYGDGLFMTWSMWRTRRLIVIPWLFVWESIRGIFGRGTALRQVLRTDPGRAMREAIHNAVREGVDAAANNVEVDVSVLDSVPIEDEGGASMSAPNTQTGRPPRPASAPASPPRPTAAPSPLTPVSPVVPLSAPPAPVRPTAPAAPATQPPPPDPTQRLD